MPKLWAPLERSVETLSSKHLQRPGRSFGVRIQVATELLHRLRLQQVVLDPVMGDEGRIYVDEDVIPAYKGLLRDADLILPNQFELEYGQP